MLSVNNVTKQFGTFAALKDLSLEFDHGVYGFLAPNGAGKTTLIKLLATLITPTKGEILWKGTRISDLGKDYRMLLGYLPQQFGYYKGYTPRAYLRYLAALKGLDAPGRKIDELLDLVSLGDVRDKKMRKFSGGMIQRVGIAQALLNDPKILLLDEPTAGLDPKERVRLRDIISNLSKDRIIIFSTHIVSDVEYIAKNIILLKDHKRFYSGPPSGLTNAMRDKVYEVPASLELPHGAVYLSERISETGTLTRFALGNKLKESLPNGAKLVHAGIEDAFLYIYRDEAKAVEDHDNLAQA